MTVAKPSLDLLRSLTEEHVLRALMRQRRLTRAEIAARTGISKPTISEAVRRLVDGGLVVDTGEHSTGRGRAGAYFTLAPAAGAALVVAISPGGVSAEAIDPFGATLAQLREPLAPDSGPARTARALADAAATVRDATSVPLRVAVVSAADPVDRTTGRLVPLPDAPLLVGDLDPPRVLAPVVEGRVMVDNDVNWAARAEREHGGLADPDNFCYLHLGEGLGAAVVCDGAVWRGHAGFAGEIAHLVTVGPDGRATRLTDVFAQLGLRKGASTAIDVERLRELVAGSEGPVVLRSLAAAVAGALSAAVALADPESIVVGGSWGRDPAFVEALHGQVEDLPRAVRLSVSAVDGHPAFVGARSSALHELRDLVAGPGGRHD